MMKRSAEKHTPYYELLESLGNARVCVFCEMRNRSTRRYVDILFYENVNDPGLRRKLIASRGFCPYHTAVLLKYGDGLGTAILYRDQAEEAIKFIIDLQKINGKEILRKARTIWDRHDPCPLCEQEEQNDTLRIGLFLENMREPEMARALESSPGLCIPHLLKVLKRSNDPGVCKDLLELHRKKFGQLLDELKEFIRKHDYRYADEKSGPEADVWQRAPGMIRGDR